MVTILTAVHITVCLFLILVVLLQAGKGGGMGIAFGGAGSQTVFGSSGAGNFLTRLTSITATIFLLTSLALAHYSSRQDSKRLQQLASEKAAEKKSDDEKAAKLKADMDKIRATSAVGKNGGAAGTAAPEGSTQVTAPGMTPPLQLKMPGGATNRGASIPAVPASPDDPNKLSDPAPAPTRGKKTAPAAPTGSAPPSTSTSTGDKGSPSATGDTAPKPSVKRRRSAQTPPTRASGENPMPTAPQTAPSPIAPAPAAPAE